jgi:dUTP pyrophosphatase
MTVQLFMKTLHHDLYQNHKPAYEGDSGIDLFFPNDIVVPAGQTVLIDLEVICELRKISSSFSAKSQSMFENISYYLYPRSSIYKTPIRLANSVGIIDAGYRNSIKVPVDNRSNEDYTVKRGQSLFQICAPNLQNIRVILSDTLTETTRGPGFGSSNQLRK